MRTHARAAALPALAVWIVAVTPSVKTTRDLLFSYGVVPILQEGPPASWTDAVKDWVKRLRLPGVFAILTRSPSEDVPEGNHRMEIIDL